MSLSYVNNFSKALAAQVEIADTFITLSAPDAALLTVYPYRLVLRNGTNMEIVEATSDGGGGVVNVSRAQEGTSALLFPIAGTVVENSPTKETMEQFVTDGATLATGLTIPNTGLHLLDTNASHDLIIAPGSDLTADHTLTLTTGDADRNLTMTADTSLGGGTHSGTNTGDQTITSTSDATSHTVTLSATGGSLQLVEGTNVTLTTTGTAESAIVTIAAAGGGGTPVGADGAVQFATSSAFDGDATGLFYDKAQQRLEINGTGVAGWNLDVVGTANVTGALTSPGSVASSFKAGPAAAASAADAVSIGSGSAGGQQSVVLGYGTASHAYGVLLCAEGATTTATSQCIIGGASSPVEKFFFGRGITQNNAALATAPVTISTTSAITGTDYNGQPLYIVGGKSTGTGAGGDLITQTSLSGSTGTTANSLSFRTYQRSKPTTITDATATTFCNIALAASKYLGARLICTVTARDATDFQSLTSEVTVDAVSKAGTITATVTQVDNTTAASAGTLTAAYTVVQNSNTIDIKVNADTSLTPTAMSVKWAIVMLNSDDVATVTPS